MPQDTEPLLPPCHVPNHTSSNNSSNNLLDHRKLHTYHMIHALLDGYLPSTEQSVANLRAFLASDLLVSTQNCRDISPAGRLLVQDIRSCIREFIDLLSQKNGGDLIQEFLWRVQSSSSGFGSGLGDGNRDGKRAGRVPSVDVGVDTKTAYDSLRIVFHLLLTNAEFRLFIDDLATIGRQIFSDTSFALSDASYQLAEQVKPSQHDLNAARGPAGDGDGDGDVEVDVDVDRAPPSEDDIRQKASRVADATKTGVSSTGHEAADSARENLLSRDQIIFLLSRLKQAMLKLRERPDYSDSLDALNQFVQRYVKASASATGEAASAAEEDVLENEDFKKTVRLLWAILQSFGDSREWKSLEQKFNELIKHASNEDPEFQQLLSDVGRSLREMMANPESLAPEKIDEFMTEQSKRLSADEERSVSDLRRDADAFLVQTKRTLRTVSEDPAISKLTMATKGFHKHACDAYHSNQKNLLLTDISHIILPRLIRNIQHIPILRLEMPSPELDLLVENLVLEPGHSVNNSSFLPYRMHITTRNDIDVLKLHSKQVQTDIETTFTATVLGLNVSASDFGYWANVHTGPFFFPFFNFKDEGIASFYLDNRGIDISLDIQIARNRLDQIFRLRGVRVQIHKLNYTIHKATHRILLWFLKPFLKHLLRRSLERQLARRILRAASDLNREFVFARERLRAARVASPPDLMTFVRAVLARGTGFTGSNGDGGTQTQPHADVGGIFKGVYSPRSLVRQWHEENERSETEVREAEQGGDQGRTWRNSIFDVAAGYG